MVLCKTIGQNILRPVKGQGIRIQIQTGSKVLLWNQVKSKKEGGYSEQVLDYKSAELKDVHTYSKYKCSAE